MIRTGVNLIEGIPVEVVRKRIRRINLRVAPDGVVRLSIPAWWSTLREGEAFLRAKWNWVRQTRDRLRAQPPVGRIAVGETEIETLRALLGGLMTRWTAALDERDVAWRLRRVKSFWGSCNWTKRLVTYNVELARAPRDLVEYVVVHELTHLQAHDHGPKFYALMDERLPGWQELRKRLNKRDWVRSEESNNPLGLDFVANGHLKG